MGESYGQFTVGNDEVLMPLVDACNIACGFHAGDPWHISKTIDLALVNDVLIGAHPGYPDLQGFGRREMELTPAELSATMQYQVAALKGMIEGKGGKLNHVKPHGSLYNRMAKDMAIAQIVMQAIHGIDNKLPVMGLAGSPLQDYAEKNKITFIAEAFADRWYEPNGTLRSRKHNDAVITDPQIAARQVFQISQEQRVKTYTGEFLSLNAQSFCIHGDNPAAQLILEAIQHEIKTNSFEKIPKQ